MRSNIKFVFACLLGILTSGPAYSSPCMDGSDCGESKGSAERAQEMDKKNLAECLARRGGDNSLNRKECDYEKISYAKYLQECFDHGYAANKVVDSFNCKQEAEKKSQEFKISR